GVLAAPRRGARGPPRRRPPADAGGGLHRRALRRARRPRPDARADAGVHRGPDRRRPGHDGAGRSHPRHRRPGRRGTARSGGLHLRRARQPAGVPMTEVDAMTSADQPSAPWWRSTRERMVRVGVLLWLALVYTALWGNMSAANVLAG